MEKSDPFLLNEKKIVITGASSGIGKAVAIECSQAGASLLLIGRDVNRLKATYDLLKPGSHTFSSIDITDYSLLEPLITNWSGQAGKIDGFVHAAGLDMVVPFGMVRPEHYEKLFSVNVVAGFELARILSKKKFIDPIYGASFVFISSIVANCGQEGRVAYSATKGAVSASVKSIALELAQKKIRVNAILPAIVKTEMTNTLFDTIPAESKQKILDAHPLGFGSVEDIAYACRYLLSDASKWITGSNLVVDGGFSAK